MVMSGTQDTEDGASGLTDIDRNEVNEDHEEHFADNFEFYIEGVLLLGVAVIGILGNLFFIIMFG